VEKQFFVLLSKRSNFIRNHLHLKVSMEVGVSVINHFQVQLFTLSTALCNYLYELLLNITIQITIYSHDRNKLFSFM
jgi:hypothetical protein